MIQFGDFFYEVPKSLMALNATSVYFVVFCFAVFLLSRPFNSIFRPFILFIANIVFVYSFGLNNLIWLFGISLLAYVLGIVNDKYHNKFIILCSALIFGFGLFGFKLLNLNDSNIIIPLGLSFYTFKIISYLCDIYDRKCKCEYNPLYFFDYVMFFPCITAGPINRADYFLSELKSKHDFDYRDVASGFFLMACGLFEKLVFCDFVGSVVSKCLDNSELFGLNVLLGVVLYSFQIYLDFDSYSNIAIGVSRMLGFKFDKNFNVPYLSTSIKDFWNRWHISLSSWLKDYIYIPLGGSKKGILRKYLNILIVFLVSGLWHGVALNYLIWGIGHGVLRIIEDLISLPFKNVKLNKFGKFVVSIPLIIINFAIVTTLWIFFKYDFNSAMVIIDRIFVSSSLDFELIGLTSNEVLWLECVIGVTVICDIFRYFFDMAEFMGKRIFVLRYALYVVLIVTFLVFGMYGGSFDSNDFIYRWF